MNMKHTLASIVLAACCAQPAAIAETAPATSNTTIDQQLPSQNTQVVIGEVIMRERMSFAYTNDKGNGQYEFEYLKIQQPLDKQILYLVNAGPSGFFVGDTVALEYSPCVFDSSDHLLRYRDIFDMSRPLSTAGKPLPTAVQEGLIYCNGILHWPDTTQDRPK